MDADSRKRADVAVKNEDDHGDVDITTKPSYRSWKKKYRKMRIVFDEKMQENERLHQMEQKALATAKRLAIYNDRLLDVLLDVNDSPQIPPEKRISLDPPSDDADEFEFKFVRQPTPPPREGPPPLKSYKSLLSTVPHITFADNPDKFPTLQEDLRIGRDSPADPLQGASYPPSFLTPDDIDNYLYELDKKLNFPDDIPTMAPLARPEENVPRDTSRDFALRNPVSVYNWLRKHAPKTFLQDGEHQDKDDDAATATPVPAAGRGAGGRATKGERSSTRGGAGTGRGGKRVGGGGGGGGARASLAAAAAAAGDDDEDTAYEGAATPTTAASKGKRKRITDDDPGYRPKGGSSRPTKKKRKSEGGVEGTPTASAKRGPRKSGGDLVMKDD